ncbi:alpha/beta hydrolase [Microbulbifer sp. OS29]|uniref:Alpha/beta hydrolase n=1 Tax=Microbulbifer okhotskensis TaxID=2926617 RepID=A0A9X2EQC6_9GAMM|nr:alpha/beta fold hydrolase [Microbulbifer okhotskensis]MCO1335874.1 alpha/beta hydrolase [Microbulbifer okhotskensis]
MMAGEYQIITEDGFGLGVTLFSPKGSPKAGVIINSATAVKQGYYSAFAKFLAQNGYLVLTYDYRGIGKSAVSNQRDQRLSMSAWGEYDLAAVIHWSTSKYNELAWHCVGHSVGGQIIGFARNNTELASVYCVSSQSGYWGHWGLRERPRVLLAWFAMIPILARVLGQVPGAFLGGESLPAGIARQWAYWGRHKDYIVDKKGNPVRDGFARLQCDMKFLSIDDDRDFAPQRAVRALKDFYCNANTDIQIIRAKTIDKKPIGHFGFFRSRYEESLWGGVLEWLD